MKKIKKFEAFERAVKAFGPWNTWGRHEHLAYGLARGVPYAAMEATSNDAYSALTIVEKLRALGVITFDGPIWGAEADLIAKEICALCPRVQKKPRSKAPTPAKEQYPLLTVVVRTDLKPGQQAVQAMHANREFTAVAPDEDLAWYKNSNTLALLGVLNEGALTVLADKCEADGLKVARFREPDLDNSLTAIAIQPSVKTRKHVHMLHLALSTRSL